MLAVFLMIMETRRSWNPVTMMSALVPYQRFWWIALTIYGLDQCTKLWILSLDALPLGSYFSPDSIEVVPNFFYLVHIGNEGAAWGILSGQGRLLGCIALVALVSIYYFRHQLELIKPAIQICFGLLTGGILGNITDRILHGHVIDFLDFHLPFSLPYLFPYGRYPAFNIADTGIVIGVFLYLILSFFDKQQRPD